MYASTKAFVSQYAACMHIEVKSLGIDVCAIHPSPVASNFYNNLDHKVDLIEAAAKNAVAPSDITDDIFRSIGTGPTARGVILELWRGVREWELSLFRTISLQSCLPWRRPICPIGRGTTSIEAN